MKWDVLPYCTVFTGGFLLKKTTHSQIAILEKTQ